MNTTQLTREGFEKLQNELKEQIEVKRPYAVNRLQKARSMGDLSENSEYHAAKEELSFVEGRILEIEAILRQTKIVENISGSNQIGVGSTVEIETDNVKETYQIVGEFEADHVNHKLSNTSPIGKALIDKKVGDIVEIIIPAGKKVYKILNIR